MGIYAEYLDRNFSWPALNDERKNQLRRISELRGRPVLVYASALNKEAQSTIGYDDRVPFFDQLSGIPGDKLDLILETPGGSAEVVEDIVENIRGRFSQLAVIIPGWAKSAGTIMALAADEILMGPGSALGPIDAQLFQNGKHFSAHAFLQGLEKIKEEVAQINQLNRAYIPILQNISPGEIQGSQNALDFAKVLVTDWLCAYKFKFWDTHSTTGLPVTPEEKKKRAEEIAEKLCDHGHWKTHGRSISMADLTGPDIRLKITDYSQIPELCDAIQRYYTLLAMSFDSTNMYKVYETPTSQIYKFVIQQQPQQPQQSKDLNIVLVDFSCPNCNTVTKIQANLQEGLPLAPGNAPFPVDDVFVCPSCKSTINLGNLRRQIESQTKKRIL